MRLRLLVLLTGTAYHAADALTSKAESMAPRALKPLVRCAHVALVHPTARAAAVTVGTSCLWGYHRDLSLREKHGERTWRSTVAMARQDWTKVVFAGESWLYAIQTMRNAISASTFLASTVLSLFTVASGFLLNKRQSDLTAWMVLPFVPTMAFLLSSAFNFSQSARLMTHAGFMFPVASDASTVVTRDTVEALLAKSEYQQWYGLRYLYLAMAFAVWPLAGEWAFLGCSVICLKFFRSIDKPPPMQFDNLRKFVRAP